MNRPSFHNILMNMALLVAQRSTCVRLQVGTVISSTDFRKVLAMGYNGNATGLPNTCDRTGEAAVGNCGCLHSEENAIVNCDSPREVEKIVFVTHLPCIMCAKRLLNLGGVKSVYYFNEYRIRDAAALLRERGVRMIQYQPPPSDCVLGDVFLEDPVTT
jgi:dCMP deaminase